MHGFMAWLARTMAIIGGAVLAALVVLTCLSVLGRGINTFGHSDFLEGLAPALAEGIVATGIGPISGDFELVEAGMAFSIFAFLPWCQLRQGHATVDIFTTVLSLAANRWIVALWEVLFAIALLLVAWRLWAGTIQMKGYGQTTFILQFPIWWAYAAALGAAVVAAITALYVAYARLAGAVTGRPLLSKSSGETH